MKIDFDKAHPFTSVQIILDEHEKEYLTPEKVALLRKMGIRCVRLSHIYVLFSFLMFLCTTLTIKALSIMGYAWLCFLTVSYILLLLENNKMIKLSNQWKKEYHDHYDYLLR